MSYYEFGSCRMNYVFDNLTRETLSEKFLLL